MEHLWKTPLAFLVCASLTCVNFVETRRSGAKKETPKLEVTEFHVRSVVVSRYARSTVLSTVFNPHSSTQEATFEVDLPPTAFISNFTITSNGKEYVSQVKGRQVAKKIYEAAKEKGQTAGLVETRHSFAEKFSVAISVPPGEHLSFKLSFEQLLARRLGSYELVLGLRPTQPVQNISVEVTITERTGISWVRVLPLQTNQRIPNTLAAEAKEVAIGTLWRSETQARVLYRPSIQEQTSSSPNGLNADFVLKYDILYTDLIGDVQVYDGYFVHYFAPQELPIVPKEVIFVIDVSGSMSGTKLTQTKEAMDIILTDLKGHDYFNIITFATDVFTWKPNGTIPATPANIKQAKAFVKKMKVRDSTNINAALVDAGHVLRDSAASREARHGVPMVIFLTDGGANAGVTDRGTMRKNARNALGSAALFSLAFGQGADYDLVRQLSLDNRGVARRVYTDSAVVLQLKGFYDEVASPMLSEVQLSYSDDQAFDVTRSLFPNYFQGSELVVAGRVHPGARNLDVTLNAFDTKKHLTVEKRNLIPDPQQPVEKPSDGHSILDQEDISGFVQRLWAYMTIKELLLTAENTTDRTVADELKQNASDLSVKYNFVTPVTSMVVVKPDTQLNEGEDSTPDSEPNTSKQDADEPTRAHSGRTPTANKRTPTRTHSGHSGGRSFASSVTVCVNRGVARRVYTDSAVVLQLKGFYDEVASPMLSEVQLSYSDDQAFDVTRSLFPNYFQGSELVVAGRVHPGARNLDVTLNAFDTKKHLTVEKRNLIPDPQQPVEKPSDGHSILDQEDISGFVQRLWAYMTIKELLLTAENTTDRTVADELKQNASDLSVKYNFVTPVTSMVVVKPDTQLNEGEDSTPDSEPNTSKQDADEPTRAHSGRTPTANKRTPTRTHSGHSGGRSFASSGDGDPHYVVYLSKGETNLCFTIDGHANDVIRLVEDPENGIIVDGRLMWAPPEVGHEDVERTYYDQIVVSRSGPQPVVVTITLDAVTVSEQGGVNRTLRTDAMGSIRGPDFWVHIDDRLRCWVDLDQGISFMVLLHHYKHPDYTQLNHLGFYLARAEGLSVGTQGLLGQFQHADIHVEEVAADPEALLSAQANDSSVVAFGTLRRGLARVPVTQKRRKLKDTLRKPHAGHCWEVQKTDVEKILAMPYEAYVQASDRWSPKFRH